uniref:Uncharacterized protein n=1 Tax=Panthera leo TaxID=9689 RepID=A0A8C8X0Z1_PANLE
MGEESPAQQTPRLRESSRRRGQVLSGISLNNPPPRDVVWGSLKPTSCRCFWTHTQMGKDFPHQCLPVFCRLHRAACGAASGVPQGLQQQQVLQISQHHLRQHAFSGLCQTHRWRSPPNQHQGFCHKGLSQKESFGIQTFIQCATHQSQICLLLNLDSNFCSGICHCPQFTEEITATGRT